MIKLNKVNKTFRIPYIKHHKVSTAIANMYKKTNYQEIQVAKDINLAIEDNEYVGIIGPNGAGKSTLLKLIAGVYKPDSGNIYVSDKVAPFIELRAGLQRELSGRDNIFLYGSILGLTRQEINQKYSRIINFAEIKKFEEQYVKEYSNGMQLRLAFAVTAFSNAKIILIDEALAVGDDAFQKKCILKMSDLNKKGKTIILVSHRLDLIKTNCKRCIWIDGGKIKKTGKPHQIVNSYIRSTKKCRAQKQ